MSDRVRRPDRKNALSLVEVAKREMSFILKMPLSGASASTIVRNVYEAFRMLGDALLLASGQESRDHVAPLHVLMKLDVQTERPLGVLEYLRDLRHRVNYHGYSSPLVEVRDVVDFAKKVFPVLVRKVEGVVGR